jgi:hypothetical protein
MDVLFLLLICIKKKNREQNVPTNQFSYTEGRFNKNRLFSLERERKEDAGSDRTARVTLFLARAQWDLPEAMNTTR